jgi:hypothetical protein
VERLQKVLAHAGVASRRACEELIRQGRVQVNGQVVTELGTKVDPNLDEISLDGTPISGAGEGTSQRYHPISVAPGSRFGRGPDRTRQGEQGEAEGGVGNPAGHHLAEDRDPRGPKAADSPHVRGGQTPSSAPHSGAHGAHQVRGFACGTTPAPLSERSSALATPLIGKSDR